MKFAFKSALIAGALVAAVASTTSAQAGEKFITPSFGTEGFALSGGYKSDNLWGATVKLSGFSYNFSTTAASYPTTGNLSLLNAGATVDFYPGNGNFRMSAGARFSNNKITATATSGAATLNLTAKQNTFQPYLGLGYSLDLTDNLALDFEAGGYYAGAVKVNYTATGSFTYDGETYTASTSGTKTLSSLNGYSTRFYPVAQVGLRMKF